MLALMNHSGWTIGFLRALLVAVYTATVQPLRGVLLLRIRRHIYYEGGMMSSSNHLHCEAIAHTPLIRYEAAAAAAAATVCFWLNFQGGGGTHKKVEPIQN